jgi:hypothetical protein
MVEAALIEFLKVSGFEKRIFRSFKKMTNLNRKHEKRFIDRSPGGGESVSKTAPRPLTQ